MKVEDAATGNEGVWIMFLVILGLYAGVGVTLVLILRKMSRRFRAGGDEVEAGGPYSPPEPPAAARRGGRGPMSDAVAVILMFGITAYALFGGADFGAGFWDLIAGGANRGRDPARSSATPSVRCGKPTTSG